MDKKALDRYLTQEPSDDSWWFDRCTDLIFHEQNDIVECWMDLLFVRGKTPKQAADIINLAIKMRHESYLPIQAMASFNL